MFSQGGQMATLTFLGADNTVTGSKHLITSGSCRILIDCGLYQGLKALRMMNWEPFPIRESTLSSILFTHAHIDHTGYLPRIVNNGFNGPVHATPPTCELARIMLPDSGRLQEEEARFANKKGVSKHKPALPLYTEEQAQNSLKLLTPNPYDKPCEIAEGVNIVFRNAGHILGSALVQMTINESGKSTNVLFTGDLGRMGTPILQDPAIVDETDYLVLESTYGDRLHNSIDRKAALGAAVKESLKHGGVLVIPAFAVERTQELLYILYLLKAEKDIPDAPVYIDSPMAVKVTSLFSRYRDIYDEEAKELLKSDEHILDSPHVHFCRTVEESKALNKKKGPMIIISASGMATGGRVLHHLMHRLPEKNNTVLLVGYQAVGTRGRSLFDGARKLRIFGENVPVNARVASLDGFSSHADYSEILTWLEKFRHAPKKVFLVHGEPDAQKSLKEKIETKFGWNVHAPAYREEVDLA